MGRIKNTEGASGLASALPTASKLLVSENNATGRSLEANAGRSGDDCD